MFHFITSSGSCLWRFLSLKDNVWETDFELTFLLTERSDNKEAEEEMLPLFWIWLLLVNLPLYSKHANKSWICWQSYDCDLSSFRSYEQLFNKPAWKAWGCETCPSLLSLTGFFLSFLVLIGPSASFWVILGQFLLGLTWPYFSLTGPYLALLSITGPYLALLCNDLQVYPHLRNVRGICQAIAHHIVVFKPLCCSDCQSDLGWQLQDTGTR